MLVLSRRAGEQIVIDHDIVLTVLAIKGQRVRIGVAAPASVRVDRQEIHSRRDPDDADLPGRPTAGTPAGRY